MKLELNKRAQELKGMIAQLQIAATEAKDTAPGRIITSSVCNLMTNDDKSYNDDEN
jgi:hypothetical protein